VNKYYARLARDNYTTGSLCRNIYAKLYTEHRQIQPVNDSYMTIRGVMNIFVYRLSKIFSGYIKERYIALHPTG